MEPEHDRQRIRQLIPRLYLGEYVPGPRNSITDVPGVLVHTQSITKPAGSDHHEVNTGVTVILPRYDIIQRPCYGGISCFNGAGEMTGSHWLREVGSISSPIVLTGSFGVGAAHEGVIRYHVREKKDGNGLISVGALPIVAETWDGTLNDMTCLAVRPEHIIHGIDNAHSGEVAEGNTGGGTGMKCHGFKAGTGTASRIVLVGPQNDSRSYELGGLVQANYGAMKQLRVGGVPVGLKLHEHYGKNAEAFVSDGCVDGSIIVILATSAPLTPLQLQRLARRATIGLARVGGTGHKTSGDIFLAFTTASVSTSEAVPGKYTQNFESLLDDNLDPLFDAAADVVEESIYNALCMAETMIGPLGRKIEALPLGEVKDLVEARIL